MPTAEDFDAAFSPRPAGSRGGVVPIHCNVAMDGTLSACVVLETEVMDEAMRAAALKLAEKFRATPEAAAGMKGVVNLRLRFLPVPPTGPPPPAREAVFKRDRNYRGLGVAGPYYPDRAMRMEQTSVVAMDCQVGEDLRLTRCRVASDSNPDFGFDFSSLRMAQSGWMTAAPLKGDQTPPADGVWRFTVTFDFSRR